VETVQVRLIAEEETAEATRLVGTLGAVVSGGVATEKVTLALPEVLPAVSWHFT